MELSEKQLLLLSEFMYLPQSVRRKTIGDTIQGLKDAYGNYQQFELVDVSGGSVFERD